MSILKKLKNELDKLNIESFTAIDQTNLSEEFAKQAAKYAYWTQMQAEADRQLAILENRKDMEYAKADEYYRSDKDARAEKYTEAVIRALVIRDEEYQEALQQVHEAEYIRAAIRGLVHALDQRSRMLMSMGAHIRAEQDMTGMAVREREIKEQNDTLKATISKLKAKAES